MKHGIFTLVLLAIALSCTPQSSKTTSDEKDEISRPNIIFMIGDGMGIAQLSSVYFAQEQEPNFSRFTVAGLIKTSSSSHKITDSAAGATAYSCGKKTYNGAIAMDTDSITALPTLLETLAKENYQTGVIATSSITHATPASYFAHTNLRRNEEEIARQLLSSPVDFFAGGGRQFFFDRRDEKNLYDSLSANYQLDTTRLSEQNWQSNQKYGYLLADNAMPTMLEGRGDFLPQATQYALDYFATDSAKPFFMMVEGSQIDWGGHANNGDYLVSEAQDFDRAIGRALDFAEKDGNTIVIVTADHECGGFALVSTEKKVPFMGTQRDYDSLRYAFNSGGHSASMVPLLAYGPGAENFTGIFENTEAYHRLMAVLEKTK